MSQTAETEQSQDLTETDILPLKQEDRTADNPMGTVLGFLGFAFMTELATDTLNIVGGMEGGLSNSLADIQTVAPNMDIQISANEVNFDNTMGMKPPTPGMTG